MDDPREVYEHPESYQILDVREPYEWNAGHIEGTIHVPLSEVMGGKGQDRLDAARPVVVFCRSGNRSELAALMLRARGFDAHNLEGGAERWVAAGLPFVAADGSPGRVA